MKRLNPIIIAFSLAVLVLPACSKSSGSSKSNTELLTQGSWKFDHATAAGAGDISTLIPSCFKDNVVTFASGGTGTITEGADVCAPSNAGDFTWAFQSNDTQINLSTSLIAGGSGVFDIKSLTETNLVLSQQMTIAPYPTTTVDITFKH